ncbi:substrate-binding domain-containing protein [Actinocrinis puniceicyclus]|uniref:Substrate-binding domain-containing protein n=1 Tax=Actinocrinis puniceicyclus TaxID=977794 RepID=A0A8J8BA82_9ACTN|nr:substrate-binding domain-containing protein [Actinocrinis puniceicyclus]MBS2962677.1 substrate-binding domain-containing protein [Actinocrinis puniceicyclus]
MRSFSPRRLGAGLACAALAAAAAGCASPTSAASGSGNGSGGGTTAGAELKIGIITAKSGPYAPYGTEYLAGLNAGLAYVTHGTGAIAGHKIDLVVEDDADNPTTAVAEAKDLIGQGVTMIGGSVDSAIALQVAAVAAQNKVLFIAGPAATDKLDALNRYTFRSGRESYQDIATAGTFVGDLAGKRVVVLAQNSEFGTANAAGVKAVLGAKGASVSSVLVPPTATDFTPFTQQILAARPDLLFVAWAGTNATQLWTALDQQGVLSATHVVTGLANTATYPATGPAGSKIQFLAHYFTGAGGNNPVEAAMTASVQKAGGTVDLFTPDGFIAAQMFAHAVQTDPANVAKQIAALEGWSFQGVAGQYTVRAADHALLQPEFQATLSGSGTTWTAKLVKAVEPGAIAPPAPATPAWPTSGS